MANLGSDNTPVKGENFSLPAGAQIDEDGGDLVIRDSGGSIVLRRDEGAGAWDFVSGDLTGIASLEADQQSTSQGQLWDRSLGDAYAVGGVATAIQEMGTTTTTDFSQIGGMTGGVDPTRMPDAATLFGNFMVHTPGASSIDVDTTVRPTFVRNNEGESATNTVAGFEVLVPSDANFDYFDSGYVELDSEFQSAEFVAESVEAKLASQSGSDESTPIRNARASLVIEWRLD